MKKIAFVLIAGLVIVASCSKKSVPTAANTTPEVATAAAAGLFGKNCGGCHGATGVEGKAPKLDHEGNKERVARVIAQGKGHMPAFADKLSANEINDIALFVVALNKE